MKKNPRVWRNTILGTTLSAFLAAGVIFSGGLPALASNDDDPQIASVDHELVQQQKVGSGNSEFIPDALNFDTSTSGSAGRSRSLQPSRFDLRTQGRVSPIRDQGSDGSCWAFSAIASLESSTLPGEHNDFSEANMRNLHGFDWDGSQGGSRSAATAYLARWSGPVKESSDPYIVSKTTSPKGLPRQKDLTAAIYLPDQQNGRDTAALKAGIEQYGAIATTMNYDGKFLSSKNAYYNPGYGQTNHGVNLVGWDDNYSAANFKERPAGNGAWIVRNSYGTDFGDKGYFYVSYYDRYIGKNNAAYQSRNPGHADNIYQYDPLGATSNLGWDGDDWYANIFTASNRSQTLNGAGIWAPYANMDYEIYVAVNAHDARDLGNRQKLTSGHLNNAGYFVIDFAGYTIDAGQNFALIVHMNSHDSAHARYVVPLESPVSGFSSAARASAGQSYASSTGTNGSWFDSTRATKNSNVALKAFTKNTNTMVGGPIKAPNPSASATTTPSSTPTQEFAADTTTAPDTQYLAWVQNAKPTVGNYVDITVAAYGNDGKPLASHAVSFRVEGADGRVWSLSLNTTSTGLATIRIPGQANNTPGAYKVIAGANNGKGKPVMENADTITYRVA